MNISNIKSILSDEKKRGIYFHEMANESRTLELLLNTCYRVGILPSKASTGKDSFAFVRFYLEKENLNSIGRLMDLVSEIPNTEFSIKSESRGIFVQLSCDSKDGEILFTRIKDMVEENVLDNKHTYSFTIMSTVYNIAKIVKEILDANILFAIDENLYQQGKCGLSIYKSKQIHKINIKKAQRVEDVINKLKEKSALHMPLIFFSTFEQLRNFYFELDETVYSKEGENIG